MQLEKEEKQKREPTWLAEFFKKSSDSRSGS
jgi:hypothetical protein